MNIRAGLADFWWREKFVLITLARFLVALLLISLFSYQVTHYIEIKFLDTRVAQITKDLSAEENYVQEQIKEIAASPGLKMLIEAKDVGGIGVELTQKQTPRHLSALSVTDAAGLTLARTNRTSRSGDYIFQTTSYGRKVAEGEEGVVSIERGTALPLMIIAGALIHDNSQTIGAVFGGNAIDDTYAHDFKTKYFTDGEQLIFYSKQTGVVGSTFDDQNTKNLISAYFNSGSDWIQKQQTDREVVAEGRSYVVKNISFPGLDTSTGGVLILFPVHYTTEAFLSALFFALLFLVVTFFFHTRWLSRKRRLSEIVVVACCFVLIFVGGFLIDELLLFSHSIVISPLPQTIYNSTMDLNPTSGIWNRSFNQTIAVNVSTGGEAINAAQVGLTYDPKKLLVESIDTTNSICRQNMFLEKTIDNKRGEVRVQCLDPSPGFSGDNGTLFQMVVQPLQTGEIALHFTDTTSVLANDGLGTDVLRLTSDASYHVVDKEPTYTNGIPSVLVFSPTYPDSSIWYNKPNPSFVWVASDYTYLYSLDQNATTTLDAKANSTTADSVTYPNLQDGIYYFHITAEKDGVRGVNSDYKIMIDTTPPSVPTIKISQVSVSNGQIVRLEFASQDALSGMIKDYYISIDTGTFLPMMSPLFVALPVGKHTITIRAFDKAGNFTDNSTTAQVSGH